MELRNIIEKKAHRKKRENKKRDCMSKTIKPKKK